MNEVSVKDFIDWYFNDLGADNFFSMFKHTLEEQGEYSISIKELVRHTNELNLYKGGKVRLV